MAIKLNHLRKRVQVHFKSLRILNENLSSSLDILETSSNATLQKVTIDNIPTQECWIFENENGEKELRSDGKKSEATILYMDRKNKKLYIIMVELKSTLTIENLIHCRDKFKESLSHISVFMLINNHDHEYDDFKIFTVGFICCQNEAISTSAQSVTSEINLVNAFKTYNQNGDKNFLAELQTITLGRQYIPIIVKQSLSRENSMRIDFVVDVLRNS
ncbi:MAG TPA: hypothetical protein ENN12_01170 [Epsilonproteobacteria bacterium]|nr:hypothetical protein [Campylobacterota bacterium]